MTAEGMRRPRVAVVGSVATSRAMDPPLRRTAEARQACRELGRALAGAGFDLAVFSAAPRYVEADVVAGYIESGAPGGTVFVHLALHSEEEFPAGNGAVTVRTVRDTSHEWEVSFYRTLLGGDAVLLVGGAQSTRIAGVVAMSQRIPLAPVAAFGGGASLVRVNLDRVRNDATDADIALFGEDWGPDSAERVVESLLGQIRRRELRDTESRREERRSRVQRAAGMVSAMVLVLLSLAGIVLAGPSGPATGRGLSVLVLAPLLASVAGAMVRNSFDGGSRWLQAAARGLGAGLVSVLLYVASQLLTVPRLLDDLDIRRLLFFVLPLGFTAGFTFDLVFGRLRSGTATVPSAASAQPPQV